MNLSEKSIKPKNRTQLKVIGNDQIQAKTKYDLKVLVKKITEQAAFSRLLAIKDTKTKMDDTSYVKQF